MHVQAAACWRPSREVAQPCIEPPAAAAASEDPFEQGLTDGTTTTCCPLPWSRLSHWA